MPACRVAGKNNSATIANSHIGTILLTGYEISPISGDLLKTF